MAGFDFDKHFSNIQKAQRRMFLLAPLFMLLNALVGLGVLAAAVFVVLYLLRLFAVI